MLTSVHPVGRKVSSGSRLAIILIQEHIDVFRGLKFEPNAGIRENSQLRMGSDYMKARTNRWDDHFAKQARSENWAARSVYKLEEIDLRFKILKQGDRVLDLGCFPGSWSQYALKKVGSPGRVVGVDTQGPLELPYDNFKFIKEDVFDLDLDRLEAESGKVDVVLSDMAPSTTGIRNTDAARSMELALRALEISMELLSRRGRMVCKVFEGEDIGRLRNEAAAGFRDLRLLRPAATRKRSRELYLIGINCINS